MITSLMRSAKTQGMLIQQIGTDVKRAIVTPRHDGGQLIFKILQVISSASAVNRCASFPHHGLCLERSHPVEAVQ